jgi:hypothetical protein
MTVEELKIEAAKLGYNIIKKQPYIKLEKCQCGKKPQVGYGINYVFCRCNYCKTEGPHALTERQARLNWNEMVKNYDK